MIGISFLAFRRLQIYTHLRPAEYDCFSERATGITAYLNNNGTLETAQHIANHESPRTTMLYDRRQEEISLDEVERMAI